MREEGGGGDDVDMSAGLHLVNLAGSQTRYNIIGAEMQVVNVELKPGDQVEVSPGAMMHHGPNIYANPHCSCSCARYCTGESNVRMEYENKGSAPETIGLTPVYPAKIIPIHLAEMGSVVVRPTSYMCGVGDVNINVSFDCCTMSSFLGGVGCIRQSLSGSGIAFLQAGGTVLEKTLRTGEMIIVDQESLVGCKKHFPCLACSFLLLPSSAYEKITPSFYFAVNQGNLQPPWACDPSPVCAAAAPTALGARVAAWRL